MRWSLAWRTDPILITYMPQSLTRVPIPVTTTQSPVETLNLFSKLLGIENCLRQSEQRQVFEPTSQPLRQTTMVDVADMKSPANFILSASHSEISAPGDRVNVVIRSRGENLTIDSVVLTSAVVFARRGMPPSLRGVDGSWASSDTSETVLCNGYVAVRSTRPLAVGTAFQAQWIAPSIVTEKIFILSAVVQSGGVLYKLAPVAITGPNVAITQDSLTGDGLNSFLSNLRSICSVAETSPYWTYPNGQNPNVPFKIDAVATGLENATFSYNSMNTILLCVFFTYYFFFQFSFNCW